MLDDRPIFRYLLFLYYNIYMPGYYFNLCYSILCLTIYIINKFVK